MFKLSDTQRILLSTASQRDGGSIWPLPASLKPGGGTTKAADALIKRGFAGERETSDPGAVRCVDGNTRYGVFITDAGLAAIGVEPAAGVEDADSLITEPSIAPTLASAPVAKTSKSALVLDLLRRPAGATLAELIEVTGWLPHTTRAALTGLRKKGHDITRGKRDGVTFYVAVAK